MLSSVPTVTMRQEEPILTYEGTFHGLPFTVRISTDILSKLTTIEADLIGAACGVTFTFEPAFSGDKRWFVDLLVSAEVEHYLPTLQSEHAR